MSWIVTLWLSIAVIAGGLALSAHARRCPLDEETGQDVVFTSLAWPIALVAAVAIHAEGRELILRPCKTAGSP